MRRSLKAPASFAAGLVLFLAGCSGDTPTAPSGSPPAATAGPCNVTVTLQATSLTPLQGTFITLRATVTRNGANVPDGSSVTFVTDLGFFVENGLRTIVKTVVDGVADVSPGSVNAGTAHIKALFDCGEGRINVEFQAIPDTTGPFISTIQPTTGSCAGGDVITIDGGNFGNDQATTRVLFGGAPGSLQSVANTEIKVKTPARTLANPSVPEQVDLVITIGVGTSGAKTVTKSKAFTYTCVGNRVFISTINPTAGSPNGGETVVLMGGFFGTNIATTRVTFCGTSAQVTAQTDNSITVTTPRHLPLTNPAGDVCDVAVTIDLGLVSQQTATLTGAFTYRGSGGGGGGCNSDPGFFVSSMTPNTGPPDGGTVVTINGGGFGTSLANVRVDFGTTQATVTGVTPTTLTVSSPRRTLANPDVPETVDVTVTDLGSPTQRCAKLVFAFRYTSVVLTPVINFSSPRIGPNDARTRVTIFGSNFQFPMQVLFGGVEATVVGSIQFDQIVVLSPLATGPNQSVLANKTVDIQVVQVTTGKTATCPGCFRYYGCPTVNGASPALAPYSQATTVTINGANFEEPLEAVYTTGATSFRLNVTSVSSSAVVVTMPSLITFQGGSIGCANVAGTITLTFQSLSCSPVTAAFTYRVDPPSMTSASPNNLNQDGSPFGTALGSPQAIITVLGANFTDPITVSLIKNGSVVGGTTINNAVVSNPGTLTFTAPAVTDASMNTGSCVIGPGVTGSKIVPTSFGIRLTNTRTGCTSDLPSVLIYNPANPGCSAGLTITTPSLPTGDVCAPYAASLTAGGGTPPYTSFAVTSGTLPPGVTMNGAGVFSGTPTVGNPPLGGQQSYAITVTVTDSASATASRGYTIVVNDPDGPFGIGGAGFQTVPNTGGPGSLLQANPNPTPPGFTPISWSILGVSPSPAPGTITLASAIGQTNNLVVSPTVPAGTYSVTVEIFDVVCSGPVHVADLIISLTKTP